jgi:hypothetical protein
MGWMVQCLNSCEGNIFCALPHQPQGPPSLPYNGYGGSLLGVKRLENGVDKPYLLLMIKKEYSCTSTPAYTFMACYRMNFILHMGSEIFSLLWQDWNKL